MQGSDNMQRRFNQAFIGLTALVAVLACVFNALSDAPTPAGTISISQLLADARQFKIARIEISRTDPPDLFVIYHHRPQQQFYVRLGVNETILQLLMDAKVPLATIDVRVAPPNPWGETPLETLSIILPVVLGLGFFFFFMRRVRKLREQQHAHPPQDPPPPP